MMFLRLGQFDERGVDPQLLSTRDADTPARKLYHSLGFTDLLRSYVFPGGGPPYAVMVAPLPLPGSEPT